MGVSSSGVYAGTIAGHPAGFMAEAYGWRRAFMCSAFSVCSWAPSCSWFSENPRAARPEAPCALGSAAGPRRAQQRRTSIASIFQEPTGADLDGRVSPGHFVAAIVLTWMPTFLYEKSPCGWRGGFSATAYSGRLGAGRL